MNRRMPNGMYGGVRGERKSPLLDCNKPDTQRRFFNNISGILGIDNKKEIHIINTVRYRTIKENQDGREKRVVRGGYWKTD